MKKTWEVKRLGEVCEVKPPKKEAKDLLGDDDLVSFAPMEDLGILSKHFTVTKERALKDVSGSYTYFSNDDVLLAKITPCFENGKLGIARNLKNGIGFGSSEYFVLRSRGELIPDYLFYFLAREQFRQAGEKVMTGAVGHKRVPKEFIENQEILFPQSHTEQKRIVTILDEAFAAIAKAKEKAEKNLRNARELFDSYLQSVFANPGDGWEEKKLGELAEIKGGKRVPKGYRLRRESTKYPYIRVTDFNDNGTVDLNNIHYVNEDIYRQIKNYTISTKDLYISIAGTIGKTGIIPEKLNGANLTENACKLTFKENVEPKFVYFFTKSKDFSSQAGLNTRVAAMPKLALSRLSTISFFIPKSISEQRSIVAKLDALSAETKKLEAIYKKKLDSLDELKKSILQKAFNGEI